MPKADEPLVRLLFLEESLARAVLVRKILSFAKLNASLKIWLVPEPTDSDPSTFAVMDHLPTPAGWGFHRRPQNSLVFGLPIFVGNTFDCFRIDEMFPYAFDLCIR